VLRLLSGLHFGYMGAAGRFKWVVAFETVWHRWAVVRGAHGGGHNYHRIGGWSLLGSQLVGREEGGNPFLHMI